MKPEGEVIEGRTTVELDTGAYRIGDVLWCEFEVSDRALAQPEVLSQYVVYVAGENVKKSREDGKEFAYLGYQSRRVGQILEGCLVFGYPGDYEKVNAKTATIL